MSDFASIDSSLQYTLHSAKVSATIVRLVEYALFYRSHDDPVAESLGIKSISILHLDVNITGSSGVLPGHHADISVAVDFASAHDATYFTLSYPDNDAFFRFINDRAEATRSKRFLS